MIGFMRCVDRLQINNYSVPEIHAKQKRGVVCCSFHNLKASRIAQSVETSNAETPRRCRYIQTHFANPCRLQSCANITHPCGVLCCFVFDRFCEFCENSQVVKTKASETPLLCMYPPPSAPPKWLGVKWALRKYERFLNKRKEM